ncbi:MAG: excinuclease ABC subunit UvrC [Candidatus Heimdallarchaeota archaeon]|nr:MAG: excinuclease ABC subunit UvrC [Candidatus Heimdallarchaeota archaeon]
MSRMPTEVFSLESVLNTLPPQPGVYLMLNDKSKIIYIGATSNLKKRVASYFRKDLPDPKTRRLVSKIKSIDYEIHKSIEAAFLRERDLIQIHSPRFNLDWKDDKQYPMIRITAPSEEEHFSRIFIVRSITNPEDWHFGRKKDVKALRASVRSLRRIFPVANKSYCFRTKKECLDYSIQRCSAPCVGKISREEYQQIVDQFILFLQGKKEDLLHILHQKMNQAVDDLDFEFAAKVRDRITQIETIIDSQKEFPQPRDKDIIILLEDSNYYMLVIFWIRDNNIIDYEVKFLGILETLPETEIIKSFLTHYYLETDFIPDIIEVSSNLDDEIEILEIWLSKKQGRSVRINVSQEILNSAILRKNIYTSQLELSEKIRSIQKKEQIKKEALVELQSYLNLSDLPRRIETYDISNIQGTFPVGSMVVFQDGEPIKSQYRRFKVKSVKPEPNDVAMLQEVLTRRLRHEGFEFASSLPDLFVIDGGKPQVNAVYNILQQFNQKIQKIPVVGLAKREEEVFLPKMKKPLTIDQDSAALRLLKQCRDEAHRFAITYHRKRRLLEPKSQLDQIDGVGAKRRNSLIQYFGDLSRIREASVEELIHVEGISRALAERIYLFFRTKPQ